MTATSRFNPLTLADIRARAALPIGEDINRARDTVQEVASLAARGGLGQAAVDKLRSVYGVLGRARDALARKAGHAF